MNLGLKATRMLLNFFFKMLLNRVISSATSAASPMTKMYGSPPPRHLYAEVALVIEICRFSIVWGKSPEILYSSVIPKGLFWKGIFQMIVPNSGSISLVYRLLHIFGNPHPRKPTSKFVFLT